MPAPTDVKQIADPLITDAVTAATADALTRILLVSPLGTKDQTVDIPELEKMIAERGNNLLGFGQLVEVDAGLVTFSVPENTTISGFVASWLNYPDAATIRQALEINEEGGGGGGVTNLSYTASASNGVVVSSTGLDATLPAATTNDAGLLLPADKLKLNNITVGSPINLGALTADNVAETAAKKWLTAAEETKLANLASLPADTNISAFGRTLIDDADQATARGTLGLGTVATTAAADYATAAQGAKAALISAFGETLVAAASNSAARTVLGLGTVATTAATDYAPASVGLLASTSLQPNNIGVSVQAFSSVLQATTASYTTADETKVDHLTVTAETDLNKIRVKAASEVHAEADLGIVPDSIPEAANNTGKLQTYFTNNGSTRQPPLVWGPKHYHLSGQCHNGNDAGYRSFFMRGVMGPNFAVQHIETNPTIASHTKLIIRDLVSPSQSWLKIDGSDVNATMPASVRFQDIVFEIPNDHVGCFLDLGDYSEATNYVLGSGGHARFRHLSIQDCYFTIRDLSAHDSGGTKPELAWLRDTADGFILQRAISDFCVRVSRCYDANIKAAFRGGSGPQLWLATCDVPNTETRHIQSFQALRVGVMDKDGFEAVRGVPGRLDFYIETPLVSGVFGDAGVFSGRVETGYSNVVKEDIGIREMPAGTTWDAPVGQNYIQFYGLPVGRTVHDYFEPGMLVRLVPVAGGEFTIESSATSTSCVITGGSALPHAYVGRHATHANGTTFTATNTRQGLTITAYEAETRTLTFSAAPTGLGATDKVRIANDHEYNFMIIAVESGTNRIHFSGSNQVCKIAKRRIVGDAAGCKRVFGVPVLLSGSRIGVAHASWSKNESYPGVPNFAIQPGNGPVNVGCTYEGFGQSEIHNDSTQAPLLVGHCLPSFSSQASVTYLGKGGWSHPFVKNVGKSQPYVGNVSEYARFQPENMYPYFWRPGMVSNASAGNEFLSYHQIADGNNQIWTVFVGEAQWDLPILEYPDLTFTVRLWSPQAMDLGGVYQFTLSEHDLSDPGSPVYVSKNAAVVSGWNTVTVTATNATRTMYAIAQRELYVAWVGATPV